MTRSIINPTLARQSRSPTSTHWTCSANRLGPTRSLAPTSCCLTIAARSAPVPFCGFLNRRAGLRQPPASIPAPYRPDEPSPGCASRRY